MAAGWDSGPTDQPISPSNGTVINPFMIGVLDLHWDNPAVLARNAGFVVVGVNVYRSDVSDRGPYFRLNDFPIGGTYWRDRTDNVLVQETIDWNTAWLSKGDGVNTRRWVFRTQHPIVKARPQGPYGQPTVANSPVDVEVYINGILVQVSEVFGSGGEVTLINLPTFDQATEKSEPALLPTATASVIINYYANRNHVRSGLDATIHYRLATVVIDATTPSGYRETDLAYCEPLSSASVERLDYIWREAVRRNQWILQQGGERVKNFIRKLAGVPCTCGMDARIKEFGGQPSNRCLTCFVPGTLVRTESGYQPIESVRVGERVLTQDGTFREVTKTFASDFRGDLVSILPSVATRPILATSEHPFLVLKGAHQKQIRRPCGPKCNTYISDGDGLYTAGSVRLLPSGRWGARVQVNGGRGQGRKALGTYDSEATAQQAIQTYLKGEAESGHVLQWDGAEGLSSGNWLVAQWDQQIQNLTEVRIPPEFLKAAHPGMPRLGPDRFEVDEDFLWMVGLYLADGSKGSRDLRFSLHREEKTIQDRLMDLFQRWGYHPVIGTRPGNGVDVRVSSTTLAEWFPHWLGSRCFNKRIPEDLMHLPPEKAWALLRGVWDGDGSKTDNEITQTSEVLALQIAELLHRVGEQPLIRRQQAESLTPKGNKRRLAFCVSWAEPASKHVNRKGRWVFGDVLLTQIRKTYRVPYIGKVHNLKVEGNHTYVVQGVITHNCYGTGYVGGFEGPYDITIAPDDAERRISQSPFGRRKEHTYEVWTGPSPLVTQRDFIVKQTNERYSIGPVRRPSNRGNILQQHFTIAYFDEQDIRYQVPIEGVDSLVIPQTRYGFRHAPSIPVDGGTPGYAPYPLGPENQMPMQTEKAGWPDEVQQRGRTPVWENQNE